MRAVALVLLAACNVPVVHYKGTSDGAIDAAVGPPPMIVKSLDGQVFTAVHAGTSWCIGGGFSRVSPYASPHLIQLDETGTPGSCLSGFDQFNQAVEALLRIGNSLYVGGNFKTYRGVPVNFIAKLDAATCALDTTFSPPNNNGFDAEVVALAASGGTLYVGGRFTAYRGVTNSANHIAKLDFTTGAIDTTFSPAGATANGFDKDVSALAVSGVGVNISLYVGGRFTAYRGVASSANGLAKLDGINGSIDTTFSPPGATTNGFNGNVVSALTVAANSLYVGGDFTAYRGVASSANRIAKLDLTTGAIDTTFSPPGAGNGFDQPVLALAATSTALYVGGSFQGYRSSFVANHVAKLNLISGAFDAAFADTGIGTEHDVVALAVSSTSLYIGGLFDLYRNAPAHHLAKVDLATGALDASFIPAGSTLNGFDAQLFAILFDGTNVWAGGSFVSYAGHRVNNIAKLDDTTFALDTTFTPPGDTSGFDSNVSALVVSGSSLYVGGFFSTYRGVATPTTALAKLDLTTGALDTAFSPPAIFTGIFTLASSTSALYVGASFVAGATVSDQFAKLDLATGALDTTFSSANANNFDNSVGTLVVSGSSLYAGGQFTKYKGAPANFIAKLDATTGALDTTFNPASGGNGFNSSVSQLVVANGSVYVGGFFTAYRGVAGSASTIAKLDATTGALDTTFTPAGTNGFQDQFSVSFFSLIASASALYVGGYFTGYHGVASAANNIAKLDLTTGAIDTTFSPPGATANGFENGVTALAISGDALYCGGPFVSYRGAGVAARLALLDATTGAQLH
jgi:hypothetical protein